MNGLKEILNKYNVVLGGDMYDKKEELLKELQSEVTKACMDTLDAFVALLEKYEFHTGDLSVNENFMGSSMSDLVFLAEQFKAQMEREGKK